MARGIGEPRDDAREPVAVGVGGGAGRWEWRARGGLSAEDAHEGRMSGRARRRDERRVIGCVGDAWPFGVKDWIGLKWKRERRRVSEASGPSGAVIAWNRAEPRMARRAETARRVRGTGSSNPGRCAPIHSASGFHEPVHPRLSEAWGILITGGDRAGRTNLKRAGNHGGRGRGRGRGAGFCPSGEGGC
jgi:hypothetical protein